MTSGQVYHMAETTHLDNRLPVWNACLCLDWLPVSNFIDATLQATVDPGGGGL